MHVGQYGDKIMIGKMEDVEDELIRILTALEEPFDISKLKGKGKILHKRSNIENTMKRVKALSAEEKEALYDTQKIAFLKYGYSSVV